ncbi:MAG: T9SS type A sorting domain-containing protein, partial [Candidatus Poribacteria bacterium]|nr:T9SS type A sorting domain-containing protein [Candidatus Poribacteria bacterium]
PTKPFTVIQSHRPFVGSVVDEEVSPSKTYYYAARLLSDAGRISDLSEPIKVEIPFSPTATLPDLAQAVVAPNPVRRSQGETLRFLNMPERVSVFIYTVTGELVARVDGNTRTFEWTPPSNLASGVYLYQIQWAPEAVSTDTQNGPRDFDTQRRTGKFVLMD